MANLYCQLKIADKLDSISGWAKHGLSEAQIAKQLGVGRSTLSGWKGKHQEFALALGKGRIEADGELLNSAFEQSIGYYKVVEELVKVKTQRYDQMTGRVLVDEDYELKRYTKYFPPNPLMTRFMLTNRLPKEYALNPDVDENGDIIVNAVVPRARMEAVNEDS